ncbi:hypothetical protein BGZ65_002145 [Modicella reniformis]|uniref:Uncharacterized protein n=1 Tax=Modicella reniformis TaxID=1440133 RepID=A0A9P6MJ70_9FUNG|nr:hypothetical protein BGZ65_002145 [Modicella reniformis]
MSNRPFDSDDAQDAINVSFSSVDFKSTLINKRRQLAESQEEMTRMKQEYWAEREETLKKRMVEDADYARVLEVLAQKEQELCAEFMESD